MADPLRSGDSVAVTVQRLVGEAADSEKANKVSRVAFDPAQSTMSWPPHWPKDAIFRPGDYCTDRYMVVDFLGRGGIAEVYEARDMLDEVLIALKVVRTTKASPDVLGKVAAEARTLKVVEHRNVLRVFDAGFLEKEELLFFSMERLVGATLHDLIYRSTGARSVPRVPALPLLKVVRMAIGIARGVNALHQQRIFHRDIKPENLFFTSDGELKVFDLDVAKFNAMCQLRTTRPGYTMGTVLYMSPELLHDGTTNERSDIYAIGLVVFELVAGHHAFASNPDQVLSQSDVIVWHSARLPPRLSSLMEGVPLALDAIVRKCVEKNPAKRFQTCEELFDKLIPLEDLLLKAEAPKPAAPVPDLVVRAGASSSPRLPLATTDRATTAVPSTPYRIVPPPLFDTPPPASSTAQPFTKRVAAPLTDPSSRRVVRDMAEPALATATSGVRRVEDAFDGWPSAGLPSGALPGSVHRGPCGTEIIATAQKKEGGNVSSVTRTSTGTERMIPLPSLHGTAAEELPPASELGRVASPFESSVPVPDGQIATVPPPRSQGLVYATCVLVGVALASVFWMLARLATVAPPASARADAPVTNTAFELSAPVGSSAPALAVDPRHAPSAPVPVAASPSVSATAIASPREAAPAVAPNAAKPASSKAKSAPASSVVNPWPPAKKPALKAKPAVHREPSPLYSEP